MAVSGAQNGIMAGLLPAWAKTSLILFCGVQLALLVTLRTASGLAHLHAVQDVSDMSAATVSARCAETVAAIDDFWPFVDVLGVGGSLPIPFAQAWGQVPRLVGIAHDTCPAVATYAAIVPAPEQSIQDGVAADALANIRQQRDALTTADTQLNSAWGELQRVDLEKLAGDPRLARVALVLGTARGQQPDVDDALAFLQPDRLQAFLGGNTPRAIVLDVVDVVDDAPETQGYAILDAGRLAATDVGQPSVPPAAIVSVNHAGLQSLRGALSHAQIAPSASDAEVARALLLEFARLPFADEQTVVAVLKHAAEDHNAFLWFDDPSLQALVTRRGWVRP
jgi:hypothetical protein